MKYGLIGEKLGHSFSPDIHKRLATSDYILKEIPREALGEFLTKKEFEGVNVTIPYKQEVIPYLHYISDAARDIGAVNVIVNKAGFLYGYNTDFHGLKALVLKTAGDISGKKVLILGTGGTSRTALAVAKPQERYYVARHSPLSRPFEVRFPYCREVCLTWIRLWDWKIFALKCRINPVFRDLYLRSSLPPFGECYLLPFLYSSTISLAFSRLNPSPPLNIPRNFCISAGDGAVEGREMPFIEAMLFKVAQSSASDNESSFSVARESKFMVLFSFHRSACSI